MSAHLDADRLGDLDEGLLPDAEAAEALEHLASCEDCQDLRAQLAEVRLLLASVPEPGPMPAEVAARIDAALSVEATRSVGEPATAAAGAAGASMTGAGPGSAADEPADGPQTRSAGATVTPLASRSSAAHTPRRRTARLTTALQVAAAVIVAGGLGAVGLGAVMNGSGGSNDSSTAAGGTARSLPEAAGPLAAAAAPRLSASGHVYTRRGLPADSTQLQRGQLRPAAQDQKATANRGVASEAPATPRTDAGRPGDAYQASKLPPRPAVDACAAALAADQPRAPIAVDAGVFEGRPAVVYLFPNPEQPAQVEVFVVAPDCRPGQENVLHFAVAPRV